MNERDAERLLNAPGVASEKLAVTAAGVLRANADTVREIGLDLPVTEMGVVLPNSDSLGPIFDPVPSPPATPVTTSFAENAATETPRIIGGLGWNKPYPQRRGYGAKRTR